MFLPVTLDNELRQWAASSEENKKLIKNCQSAIVVLGQNKQPIKKLDLNKLIYTGSRSQHHTVTKAVIANANHYVHKYLGMRLFELADRFLLVNSSSIPNQCRKEFDQEECNELAVIFLALMEIFSSSDESSTESQIKAVIQTLDLSDDDLKRHFDMLLKKLYIVQLRDKSIQQDEKLYKWGPRAIAEVDPDRFMKSFLDFAEAGTENDWAEQKRRIDILKAMKNRSI